MVDCFYRDTLAYDREMSHFIALAASYVRSWAVPPSRGMSAVAITTVPATHLEGLPLKVSLGPLLCILISDQVWPVPSRCDTLNLFDSCNSRFVASFKDRIFTAFSSERAAPSS